MCLTSGVLEGLCITLSLQCLKLPLVKTCLENIGLIISDKSTRGLFWPNGLNIRQMLQCKVEQHDGKELLSAKYFLLLKKS